MYTYTVSVDGRLDCFLNILSIFSQVSYEWRVYAVNRQGIDTNVLVDAISIEWGLSAVCPGRSVSPQGRRSRRFRVENRKVAEIGDLSMYATQLTQAMGRLNALTGVMSLRYFTPLEIRVDHVHSIWGASVMSEAADILALNCSLSPFDQCKL